MTPSQESALKALLDKSQTPQQSVDALIAGFEAQGLSPVSWRVMSKFLKSFFGDLDRSYEKHFDSLMEPVGRGFYVRKGGGGVLERPPRAPRASRSEGLSWSPAFLAPDQERESWYSEDAGLRRLALSQTKCFSSYSEGEKSCGVCPLARFCQEASFAKMDELARLLDEQEEARILAESSSQPQASSTSQASSQPQASSTSQASSQPQAESSNKEEEVIAALAAKGINAKVLIMPFAGVCSACNGQIAAGEKALSGWLRGLFHVGCAK